MPMQKHEILSTCSNITLDTSHNHSHKPKQIQKEMDTSHMSVKLTATLSFLSSQKYLTAGFSTLIVISVIIILYTEPELQDEEQRIVERLGQLHLRERNLDMGFRLLKEETSSFVTLLNQVMSALSNCSGAAAATATVVHNTDIRRMLTSFSNSPFSLLQSNDYLKAPTVYSFLPHLLSNFSSLRPFYKWSKNRAGVSTILGIPTVKRSSQSYLLSTLNDLIYKMSAEERNDALIVVFIAEVDANFVQQVVNEIKSLFENEMESGLIDIISPPASFYPDFENLPATLSDPVDRVRWRSKQSLDFAFLMTYAYPKGMLYIQLEDDIMAKQHYLTTMKDAALTRTANKQPWFVLDFCQLGFIGKMFRCADLPWIIQFFFMFFNDKPVDWLLDGFIQTKVCNLEKDNKDCRMQKDHLWVHVKPSLFQHIGTTSSLKGKIQKLKDKHFGKVPLFYGHRNPPATLYTSIKAYKKYTLGRAYNGETFFWGMSPRKADFILFQFQNPINIARYKFKTGNVENPSDKLYNTTISVAVASEDTLLTSSLIPCTNNTSKDAAHSFITVGEFNGLGFAEGVLDKRIGLIKELRLTVHNDCENWVIISEIQIVEDRGRNSRS